MCYFLTLHHLLPIFNAIYMKHNPILSLMSILISALFAFGFYTYSSADRKIYLGLGSFLFLSTTILFLLAIKSKNARKNTNLKVVSMLFSLLAFFSHLFFSIFPLSFTFYFILNGLFLIGFFLSIYALNRAFEE